MVNGKGGFIGSELSFYGADVKPDQIRAIILDPDGNQIMIHKRKAK